MMTESPVVFGLELQDQRTHTERIYELETTMLTADGRLIEEVDMMKRTKYAAEDHPDGEKRPYALRAKAFVGHVMLQPGAVVELLPHEVGPQHVPVKREEPVTEPASDPT